MELDNIEQKINNALDILYEKDDYLIRNGLCERCICHKFAIYLEQQSFGEGYFVDCEYNRAYSLANGGVRTKKITSKNGNSVDIVITKRNDNVDDDLVCFETKKCNNKKDGVFELDREKLSILVGNKLPVDIKNKTKTFLTDDDDNRYCFNYKYGFFIIFGENREETKVEVYKQKN